MKIFKNFIFLSIFFMLTPSYLFAQSTMSFSGSVIEKDSGRGLSNVKIKLWRETRTPRKRFTFKTTTNSKGEFFIDKLPKDKYKISVKSEDNFIIDPFETHPIDTSKGLNVTGIKITLDTGCAIKGRVMANESIPIPKPTVLTKGSSTFGDENGDFLLKGLTPGLVDYTVIPDTIGAKAFKTKCEKGKVVDVGNLIFTVNDNNVIQGFAVDGSGNAVSGAIVVATSKKHEGATYITSDKGEFIIAGLEGPEYDLKINSMFYEQKIISNIKVPSKKVIIKLVPKPGIEKSPLFKKHNK